MKQAESVTLCHFMTPAHSACLFLNSNTEKFIIKNYSFGNNINGYT